MLAEDVFDDVQDSPVLEDAAVAGAGEKPEPGDQGSLVEGNGPIEASVGKTADNAIE